MTGESWNYEREVKFYLINFSVWWRRAPGPAMMLCIIKPMLLRFEIRPHKHETSFSESNFYRFSSSGPSILLNVIRWQMWYLQKYFHYQRCFFFLPYVVASFLSHSLTHLSQIKLNCGREIRYEKTQSERRRASVYVQKITQATSLFYHIFWRTGDGQWTLPELNMIIASASWCEILLSPLSRRQNGRNVSLINAIPFLSFTSPKVHFRFGTDFDGSIAHQ